MKTREEIIARSRELFPVSKPLDYLNEGQAKGFINGYEEAQKESTPHLTDEDLDEISKEYVDSVIIYLDDFAYLDVQDAYKSAIEDYRDGTIAEWIKNNKK